MRPAVRRARSLGDKALPPSRAARNRVSFCNPLLNRIRPSSVHPRRLGRPSPYSVFVSRSFELSSKRVTSVRRPFRFAPFPPRSTAATCSRARRPAPAKPPPSCSPFSRGSPRSPRVGGVARSSCRRRASSPRKSASAPGPMALPRRASRRHLRRRLQRGQEEALRQSRKSSSRRPAACSTSCSSAL